MRSHSNSHATPEIATPSGRRSWRWMFAVFTIMCLGVVTISYYRYHLDAFLLTRQRSNEFRIIQTARMPEVAGFDGQLRRRIGHLHFLLAEEMAECQNAGRESDIHIFAYRNRQLVVVPPCMPAGLPTPVLPPFELRKRVSLMTVPRLRIASYGATVTDVSWSTSPLDVQWKLYLISSRPLLQLIPMADVTRTSDAEWLTTADIELVVQYGFDRAVVEWEATDRSMQGYMHFSQRDESIDRDWVRAVCRSIAIQE